MSNSIEYELSMLASSSNSAEYPIPVYNRYILFFVESINKSDSSVLSSSNNICDHLFCLSITFSNLCNNSFPYF